MAKKIGFFNLILGLFAMVSSLNAQSTAVLSGSIKDKQTGESLIKAVVRIEELPNAGIISNEYSWIDKGNTPEKGAQIDFIIDRNDNCITILELKFYDTVFEITKNYAEELQHKVTLFKKKTKTNKNVFITMLTANGVKNNEYYLSVITNELNLSDLF